MRERESAQRDFFNQTCGDYHDHFLNALPIGRLSNVVAVEMWP